MARKLTIERQRVGALSEADYWSLSIGPDTTPSQAELRRLHAVYRAHPDGGYHGTPHTWAFWQFDSGLSHGHCFTGELVLSWLWLEARGWLTRQEATALASAREQRDELAETHPAAIAAEYHRRFGLDALDHGADPLGEARRRRARWLHQKET